MNAQAVHPHGKRFDSRVFEILATGFRQAHCHESAFGKERLLGEHAIRQRAAPRDDRTASNFMARHIRPAQWLEGSCQVNVLASGVA
ncbi:hypothetical protein [Burkholderia aenigmatica]|uniref:hypothetical protein n=1 Tax=Burkholderia aenigmatica TaxID=2015348 RepID=UPI001B39405C|nr:hypothetical protein [Burkholderia aenigmatica]